MLMQEQSRGKFGGSNRLRSNSTCSLPVSLESGSCSEVNPETQLREEVVQFSEEKKNKLKMPDEDTWKQSIRRQTEEQIERRVREALDTPPQERMEKARHLSKERFFAEMEKLNAHVERDLSGRENRETNRKWKAYQARRKMKQIMSDAGYNSQSHSAFTGKFSVNFLFNNSSELSRTNHAEFPGVFGLENMSEGFKNYSHYAKISAKVADNFGGLSEQQRHEFFYSFSKEGFRDALRTGRLPDGSEITDMGDGKYVDKYGVIRDQHGPFWPPGHGPLYPAPVHKRHPEPKCELLSHHLVRESNNPKINVDNQKTIYSDSRWRGVQIIFDSEKSNKDYEPLPVSEGNCPSLKFESRFECGNLRQARRVGQFEYELVLKTDLYTSRHTQWYYFRVQNAIPGIIYKFRIINLLKRDSLYNHGMRPLLYSEKDAKTKNMGWQRRGHHISYTRNITNLQCPLLQREMAYHMLEWQMSFPNADDTYYLAHCYPYTYTDLKDDLDSLVSDPIRSKVLKREVMCETRAGNSCFLLTVTDFDSVTSKKKGVVLSARVHPGESNSSWMMKGLLDYLTSPAAKELRSRYVFKVVPMLNPDGVIVGNYRCSLTARDLNRNYRHPRRESFPTVWYTKAMMEELARWVDVVLYCDLHGHSRKANVFMYGCNNNTNPTAESFLNERLFPWLMSQKAPEKFSFQGCKFQIKKCKESTGRVVMYRQMKIDNSFTMEATFCGTTLCNEKRHFNTRDFMEMGKVLAEVILDYTIVNENKNKQLEVILSMTKAITHQILQSRNLSTKDIPELTAVVSPGGKGSATSETNVSITAEASSQPTESVSSTKTITGQQKESSSKSEPSEAGDISKLLDGMPDKSISGCMKFLEQLQAPATLLESDSSDSDSESEPEMKYVEPRSRRKKKKKRKSKDSGSNQGQSNCQQEVKDRSSPDKDKKATHSSQPSPGTSSASKLSKASKYPVFINKYLGRSNGGIPCFSEERCLERASKRMAEMKQRAEEQKQREVAMYYHMQEERYNSLMAFSQQFQQDPGDMSVRHRLFPSASGDVADRIPAPFRVGYQHAADQELAPTIQNLHTRPQLVNFRLHESGSESGSSEEDDDVEELRLPIPAISSPYHNVNMVSSSAHPMSAPQTQPHRSSPLVRQSTNLFSSSSTTNHKTGSSENHGKLASQRSTKQTAVSQIQDPREYTDPLGLTGQRVRSNMTNLLKRNYTDLLLHKYSGQNPIMKLQPLGNKCQKQQMSKELKRTYELLFSTEHFINAFGQGTGCARRAGEQRHSTCE